MNKKKRKNIKFRLSHFVGSLPFDQKTTIGYSGEILYDLMSAETYFISIAVILLFISMCQHHQAFLKIFQHSLRKLDRRDQNRNDEKLLRKLIRFHVLVKE